MRSGYHFSIPRLLLSLAAFFTVAVWTGLASPPGSEILSSDRLLASEPSIEISKTGGVLVRIKTLKPCRGGEAFLGVYPQAAALAYPVFRFRCELNQIDSLTLSAKFELKDLEEPQVDISLLKERNQGQIALRISLFSSKLHNFERVFVYGVKDSSYLKATALVEGPLVNCVTDTSAIVSWGFDRARLCTLKVDPGNLRLAFPEPASHYEIPLYKLSSSTRYRYTITWSDQGMIFQSQPLDFQTAPVRHSNQPFRFAIMSDGRANLSLNDGSVEGVNYGSLRALFSSAYTRGANFILFPGDLVSGNTSDANYLEDQFRSWKRITAPVGGKIPIYEGMGNHDETHRFFQSVSKEAYLPRSGVEASEAIFARAFINPTDGPEAAAPGLPTYRENVYSFDWGNSHFTMLNNNYFEKGADAALADSSGELEGMLRDEQLTWLEKDLAAARQRSQKHIFIFLHEPPFPCGGHAEDAMWWEGKRPEILKSRQRFWQILCKYRALTVFAGHEHNYCRALIDQSVDPTFSVPIWQIITGGAGAPFYNRDRDVPWAEAVKAFSPLQHYCLLEVEGDAVRLTAISIDGVVIEKVELTTP